MVSTYGNSNPDTDGEIFLAADTISVTPEGVIFNDTGDALSLQNTAGYVVSVKGSVGSASDNGISLSTIVAGLSKVTVGSSGEVFGDGCGIIALHATNITNSGFIGGGDVGIDAELSGPGASRNFKIVNNVGGEIVGGSNDGIFLLGTGTHTIINKGRIATQSIFFAIESNGTGIEHITNSGTISGNIFLDLGDDSFKNTGKGQVFGEINLGGGVDKFFGNNSPETVRDGSGADIVKFGGGMDIYKPVKVMFDTEADGFDKIDGGAGADWYDASEVTNGLRINLDTKAHVDGLANLQASQVTGSAGPGDTGTDKVTHFENAVGGNGDDIIFGNNSGNWLQGNFGFDHLFGLGGRDFLFGGDGDDKLDGGAGNDVLYGEQGSDTINGGAGKDELWGGSGGPDTEGDVFVFSKISDSAPGRTHRDVIFDFNDGAVNFDRIDVSAIGGTDFIGINTPFNGTDGELRVVATQLGWIVQGDMDGNKKVDFAVEVRDASHSIVWDATNFVLIV